MESERKIEKLLRAYAKKRKAQAGDPLQLHPATRRMLLDEVARSTPKPEAEDESVSLWELFRQQWAVLLGFALIVFFVATMFLPSLSSAKKKAQTVATASKLKQIGAAAQISANENFGKLPASLDTLTNGLVTDKTLMDAESGKHFVYAAGGANLDDLSSNTVLAYSPTDKKDRAVLFADGRVEVVNGTRFSELTNRAQAELALAKDTSARRLDEKPAEVALGNAAATSTVSGQLKSETKESKLADLDRAKNKSELGLTAPVASAEIAWRTGRDRYIDGFDWQFRDRGRGRCEFSWTRR